LFYGAYFATALISLEILRRTSIFIDVHILATAPHYIIAYNSNNSIIS